MIRCLGCRTQMPTGSRSYCKACQARDRGSDWNHRIAPAVRDRDGHRCTQCGRPCPHLVGGRGEHHVDHITPRAFGGSSSDLSNLRTVCRSFNLKGRCK